MRLFTFQNKELRNMKKSLILAAISAALLIPNVAQPQGNNPKLTQTTAIRIAFDTQKLTVDSTAGGVGFTSSIINPSCTSCDPSLNRASAAACTLETAEIRISTVTADAPTTTTGMLIPAGSSIVIYGYADISTFKAIRTGGTSGVLNCTFYR